MIYIYGFYLSIIALFALSGKADAALQHENVIRALWVGSLLSVLFTSQMLFSAEEENGLLGYLPLWPIALEWLVLAKFMALQLVVIAPLTLLSFALASLFGLPAALAISLLLGLAMLAVSAVVMLASALSVGVARKGALGGILVLPLIIPVMVFGAAASMNAQPWQHAGGQIIMAYSLLICPLSIIITAAMLRLR